MNSIRSLVILLLLLCPGFQINAQLISVKSFLEKDSILIGDQVSFTLHVEVADQVETQMPVLTDTLSRNIEVLFPVSMDTINENGIRMMEHRYMITSFESGMQLIPSQKVIYAAADGRLDTALSMPVFLQVSEPAVDTTQQIKPIKGPINTPLTFRELLPWIGLGVGGLVLALAIYMLVKKYRRRDSDSGIFSLKPQEPAHVIAFRELDKLKEEKIWEKGKVKQYYSRLTEITRQYIERQYGIPAMESTTDEILHAFRKSNTEDSLLDEMLQELLELADLVKFAREDPLPMDNQTNMNNAYIFVQKTYPLFYKAEPDGKGGGING